MSFLILIGQKLGLDKSIAYSSGARIVQGVAGVGSMFFISTFLSGVEQGFYFTFGSILALQVFFELGLTGIMTQYVAHEASHLTLNDQKHYEGDEQYKSRLASLLHFCIKWYFILAIIVFIFLIITGFVYFNKYGEGQGEIVNWKSPWFLICIATSIELFISPITSILTGLGYVKETSKISFYRQLLVPLCTWIGLAFSFKLFVTGIGHLISIIIWFYFVVRQGLVPILFNLWKTKISTTVSYMKEIFPYQWKIALSWVSGYFIFQLFNPVLFATEGAVVAGQMGMTLTALNAISAFSMSWLNTKIPLYSRLIAIKDYNELDSIFNRTLKQMTSICLTMLVMLYVFIGILRITHFSIGNTVFADRFLDYLPLFLMMIPIFTQQFVSSWATYLRCHKQEPFLVISVVGGLSCMGSTFLLGNTYGLYGITIGYCIIQLILLPWAYSIFKTYKLKWHGK